MNVVLVGPPGAGKGTLTSMLTSKYGFKQVAIGDILREGAKEQTTLGRMVKKSMDRGQLVQDEVVDALLLDRQPVPCAVMGHQRRARNRTGGCAGNIINRTIMFGKNLQHRIRFEQRL